MPIATLQYDLSEPDEARYASIAFQSVDWVITMVEYDGWLRDAIKHNPDGWSDSQLKAIEAAREILIGIMQDSNLTTDVLP